MAEPPTEPVRPKRPSLLTLDRAAFLMLRVKNAFRRKKKGDRNVAAAAAAAADAFSGLPGNIPGTKRSGRKGKRTLQRSLTLPSLHVLKMDNRDTFHMDFYDYYDDSCLEDKMTSSDYRLNARNSNYPRVTVNSSGVLRYIECPYNSESDQCEPVVHEYTFPPDEEPLERRPRTPTIRRKPRKNVIVSALCHKFIEFLTQHPDLVTQPITKMEHYDRGLWRNHNDWFAKVEIQRALSVDAQLDLYIEKNCNAAKNSTAVGNLRKAFSIASSDRRRNAPPKKDKSDKNFTWRNFH